MWVALYGRDCPWEWDESRKVHIGTLEGEAVTLTLEVYQLLGRTVVFWDFTSPLASVPLAQRWMEMCVTPGASPVPHFTSSEFVPKVLEGLLGVERAQGRRMTLGERHALYRRVGAPGYAHEGQAQRDVLKLLDEVQALETAVDGLAKAQDGYITSQREARRDLQVAWTDTLRLQQVLDLIREDGALPEHLRAAADAAVQAPGAETRERAARWGAVVGMLERVVKYHPAINPLPVLEELDVRPATVDAPGHRHLEHPGHHDAQRTRACGWCATWAELRAYVSSNPCEKLPLKAAMPPPHPEDWAKLTAKLHALAQRMAEMAAKPLAEVLAGAEFSSIGELVRELRERTVASPWC